MLKGPPEQPTACETSCTASYEYDPLERLVREADGHGRTTAFTLDPRGNVLTEETTTSGQTTTHSFGYEGQQLRTLTEAGQLERATSTRPRASSAA